MKKIIGVRDIFVIYYKPVRVGATHTEIIKIEHLEKCLYEYNSQFFILDEDNEFTEVKKIDGGFLYESKCFIGKALSFEDWANL